MRCPPAESRGDLPDPAIQSPEPIWVKPSIVQLSADASVISVLTLSVSILPLTDILHFCRSRSGFRGSSVNSTVGWEDRRSVPQLLHACVNADQLDLANSSV
jgi:hypothetical protein